MVQTVNSKKLSQERYTRFAEGYIASNTHARGSELELLVAMILPRPDWIMLDIATGGGHTALKFSPLVKHVIAVDLTERMLSVARGFVQSKGIDSVEFLAADAEFLPFAAESFDLVTCRIAAHHFPDIAPFARESARVLRPGGRLLFQDQVLPENEEAGLYVDNFERLRDPSHHGAFHRRAWETFFEDADLSILQEEIVIKRHMFLDWAQRQGCTAETIAELTSLVQDAPIEVRDWLLPEKFDSLEEASFCNRHIILVAVKNSHA